MLYFLTMNTRILAGGFLAALIAAFGFGLYFGITERLENTASAA